MRLQRYLAWPGRIWLVGRQSRDDRRSVVARGVDKLIAILLLWLALYLTLSWYLGQRPLFWPAFILAALLSAAVVQQWQRGQKALVRHRQRAWQAAQELRQEMSRVTAAREMVPLVQRLLRELPGLQEVAEPAGTAGEEAPAAGVAFLEAQYNGKNLLVACIVPEQSQPDSAAAAAGRELSARQAREVLLAISRAGYTRAVLVPAGRVSAGALLLARRWRHQMSLYWLDLEQMARLAGWLALRRADAPGGKPGAAGERPAVRRFGPGFRGWPALTWPGSGAFLKAALCLVACAGLLEAHWRPLYLGAALLNAGLAGYSYYIYKTAGQWGLPR
ncbi:MAG: hypothetical protein ACUVTU_04895 [Desulfurispora sp.]|uniref:hypothetical protein n=1 Tax=Desulfurispora sp. TaxID=3014275 RepID=UPI0040494FF5